MTAQRRPDTKARRAVDKTARKAVAKLRRSLRSGPHQRWGPPPPLSGRIRRKAGRSADKLREVGDKKANSLDARTRRDLYELARRWGIRGRSRMLKQQLIDAVRRVHR